MVLSPSSPSMEVLPPPPAENPPTSSSPVTRHELDIRHAAYVDQLQSTQMRFNHDFQQLQQSLSLSQQHQERLQQHQERLQQQQEHAQEAHSSFYKEFQDLRWELQSFMRAFSPAATPTVSVIPTPPLSDSGGTQITSIPSASVFAAAYSTQPATIAGPFRSRVPIIEPVGSDLSQPSLLGHPLACQQQPSASLIPPYQNPYPASNSYIQPYPLPLSQPFSYIPPPPVLMSSAPPILNNTLSPHHFPPHSTFAPSSTSRFTPAHEHSSSSQPHDQSGYSFAKLRCPRFASGDPTDWIYKTELYFRYNNINPIDYVFIASLYLDSPASTWFQGILRDGLCADWHTFKEAIKDRFGPSDYEDPLDTVIHTLPDSPPSTLHRTSALEILSIRTVEQNGKPVKQGLIQWEGLLPEEATWENIYNLDKETQNLINRYCVCQDQNSPASLPQTTTISDREDFELSQINVIPPLPRSSSNLNTNVSQEHSRDLGQRPPGLTTPNRELLSTTVHNVISPLPRPNSDVCSSLPQENNMDPEDSHSGSTLPDREILSTHDQNVIFPYTMIPSTNVCKIPVQETYLETPQSSASSRSTHPERITSSEFHPTSDAAPSEQNTAPNPQKRTKTALPERSSGSSTVPMQTATPQDEKQPRRSLRSASKLLRGLPTLPRVPRRRRTVQRRHH